MDLNDMRYFALVVAHNGFAAAERASGISKSKLSRRISEMENSLGLNLLRRNTRSLELSPAGEEFYNYCRSVTEEAEAAQAMLQKLKAEPSGGVRLSCPNSINMFYLTEILSKFMKKWPKVKVTLLVTNNPVRIINERIDVAILTKFSLDNSRQDFVVKKLTESRMVLLASPDYLEKYGTPAGLEELPRHTTISSVDDRLEGPATWEFTTRDGLKTKISHQPRFRTHDTVSQISAVLHGLGIGLVPEPPASREIRQGRLIKILPEYYGEESPIMVAFLSRRGLLPAVRTLLDYLSEQIPAEVNRYLHGQV
ncbi:LysR family transcriptional regulator [Deltaproteobacteria bacterium Smac51]|nr:LysR family transcriptional regulator [Deltaproteobacteria bacterium Smac51]